ncbi:MAG: glycosyltransferase [Janthinobacterium lividum]
MSASTAPFTSPEGASERVGGTLPRWVSVVTHTDPRYGGLSTAVPRSGMAAMGTGLVDVSLAAFCVPEEHIAPPGYDGEHLSFWPAARGPWLTSSSLRRRFSTLIRAFDGVHIHGLWEASTAMASRTARSTGRPYIVSAHGMLEPWALANKRLKKLLYAGLVERNVVAHAACLHALTYAEAEQYRAFGARAPIAVIPNAVAVPPDLSSRLFFSAYPQLSGHRLVLFLGRLHPKKGLDLLAKAWSHISHSHPDAHLVLAGPDAEGTADRFGAVLEAAKLANTVTFTGMLDESMKWSALAAAECFVLPSFSEGLSMGVLEAMGAGVPVIVTRNCNMPEVLDVDAGWVIAPDAAELQQALEAMLGAEPQENRAKGAHGARLITNRYNARHVAQQTAEVYEYVRNGIPPVSADLLL